MPFCWFIVVGIDCGCLWVLYVWSVWLGGLLYAAVYECCTCGLSDWVVCFMWLCVSVVLVVCLTGWDTLLLLLSVVECLLLFDRTSSHRGSSDRRSRSRDRDRDRSSGQESSSRQKSPTTSYKYRSSATAAEPREYRSSATAAEPREYRSSATAAEPRERRHYDALASSASSSASSFDKRRNSDKLERDRGDRSGGIISENDVVRERGRERERDRERERGDRERGGDGDYVSRSSRR